MMPAWFSRTAVLVLACAATMFTGTCRVLPAAEGDGVSRLGLLPPREGNPRNSEGDFIQLNDGRLMLVYTHFTGGGSDHAAALLAARFSSDGGRTWTGDDVTVVPNEGGFNVMSVSLVRLDDGRIALFYLRKNSLADCRPVVRFSSDEAGTFGPPEECISDQVAYYVMNNDRAVQLSTGRIVLPLALHEGPDGSFVPRGRALCYLSDDRGRSWRRSKSVLELAAAPDSRNGLQEPGVVELKDGSLLMFCRTDQGCQYFSRSRDGGDTWSAVEPSELRSPVSPASIKRIPSTGDLMVVWNDHRHVGRELEGKRTPLSVAVSRDEGRTWQQSKPLETDPGGWYCYTAIEFVGPRAVLAHCAGQRATGGLNRTQITSFDVKWVYDQQ